MVGGRIALLVALLYLFLVAIKLLEGGIKMFGEGTAEGLFTGVANPFAGLAVGILATALMQSSSATTSIIVGLVGSGTLGVSTAVPMIMGANIGTTVTNTLVSIGHVRRSQEFRRAFAAATVHDFFNVMAVAVMLPLELATGFLSKSAHAIASGLEMGGGGAFKSPIKTAVKAGAGVFQDFVTGTLGISGGAAAGILLGIGVVLVFVALAAITKNMRSLIAAKAEKALNAALKRSAVFAVAIGTLVTVAVQSSSITTSLLVPLCGSGILTLEAAFPVMLGANIGTTITAFLASMASDQISGLEIALVHVLFNTIGVIGVYPVKAIRRFPMRLATGLAVRATGNKLWVLAYVGFLFVLVPMTGILLFR
ncbi:MAG: Na/Pi symporter [Planctomycetes bacterium]|nr:Na/Pi symporter [Planctomycetota bacterium]